MNQKCGLTTYQILNNEALKFRDKVLYSVETPSFQEVNSTMVPLEVWLFAPLFYISNFNAS